MFPSCRCWRGGSPARAAPPPPRRRSGSLATIPPAKTGHAGCAASPTRLLDAGYQPVAGQVAEADAADAELAIHRPRPPTQLAATLDAYLFPGQHRDPVGGTPAGRQLRQLPAVFDVLCFGSHG